MHQRSSTITSVPGGPRSPLELSSITHAGTTFYLSQPISVNVEVNKSMWILECEQLRILAYGESQEKALVSFSEDFADLYAHIATAADTELAADARQLKARMRKLVRAVRT